MQPPLWLGVDVGTSATRVVVVADDGTVVAGASAGYETKRAAGGVAEQEPAHWLGALEQALALAGVASLVPAAMGLCGQTPTLVLTGSDGEAVRPALTWQDTRARDEAIELAERFGDPAPLVGTALPWSAANMPAKLLWLARHEPAAVRQTRWLLQPKDFVAMALTGSPLSDPWCSKGLCRVDDGAPVSELLEACGWPSSSCPPLGAPWQQRGTVSAAAARSFGLPAGLPVSIGWSDALVQILAAGSFERQSAFVFSGTSSIVGTPVAGTAAGARAGGLFHVPRFCAPSPLLYGPTQSSGASIAWAARLLGVQPEELPALAAAARGESPVFVPYLSGERAPLWNQDVRALFLGLSDEHGPPELASAVLSGVLCSARHVLDLVEQATGAPVREIEVVGRGVGDPDFEAAAVRVLGSTLRFHDDADTSARGAAMLAAIVAGAGIDDAVRRLGDATRTAQPGPDDIESSARTMSRYRVASDAALAWSEQP